MIKVFLYNSHERLYSNKNEHTKCADIKFNLIKRKIL